MIFSIGMGVILAGSLTPIQIGDKMGLLRSRRGQVPGRHQSSPKQILFVFTIQDHDLHDKILELLEQGFDRGMPGAFIRVQLLPGQARLPQVREGFA